MTPWVRLWHDMPTDPKWRVIARKSGQPLTAVLSVFVFMMTNASGNSENRGSLTSWDDEDVAAALDIEPEAVRAIASAMQGKVLEGNSLTGWDRRQPKREDDSVARVRKHREEKNAAVKRSVTRGNAPDTDTDTDSDTDSNKKDARTPAIRLEFETVFWPSYPERVGKPKALEAFADARGRADLDTIMDGVSRYKRDKPQDRSWAHPTTWLTQDRWLDDPAPAPTPTKARKSGSSKMFSSLQGRAAEREARATSDDHGKIQRIGRTETDAERERRGSGGEARTGD